MRTTLALTLAFALASPAFAGGNGTGATEGKAADSTGNPVAAGGTGGGQQMPPDEVEVGLAVIYLDDFARTRSNYPEGEEGEALYRAARTAFIKEKTRLDKIGLDAWEAAQVKVAEMWRGAGAEGDRTKQPIPPNVGNRVRRINHDSRVDQPGKPVFDVASGEDNMRRGNYTDAFRDFGSALQKGDKQPETYAGYSAAAHQLGDYKTASAASAEALKLDPNNVQAFAVYKLSKGKEGISNAPTLAAAGGMNLGGGQSQSAVTGPAVASSRGPAPTAAEIAAAVSKQAQPSAIQQSAGMTKQAASALKVRDYTAAKGFASSAIELNSQNAQAWNYRAIANEKLRNYPAAVFDASAALALIPQNPAALQTRAMAFNRQGMFNEGLADSNAVLEMDPRDAYAYQGRAFALAGLKDNEAAIESLKLSASLDQRFEEKYEKALQAPDKSDLLFLFDDGGTAPTTAQAAPLPPGAKKKRFAALALNSVVGGILVAMGFLHVFSSKFREGVKSTVRRFIGTPGAQAAGEAAEGAATPQFWGQYELLKEIGTGGMGVVYEAKDRSLDRPVAIKRMREELRVDPQERSRFMAEAKTVAALHHPNIVDIYNVVEDQGDVYLVFEFVKGNTLADVIREKGPMPFEAARNVLKAACEAVDYAHKHKVIHRDIKPSNIMVSEEGAIKVMDFGVARQAKDALTKLAMTNTVVGTPPYMAPEQEQGTVRPESDVYSLGIVFYEMLTGQLPFAGQGAGMLLNKMNGKHSALPTDLGLPDGLDVIFKKALDPDPEKRFKTGSELTLAVESLAFSKLV
jgi:tetratricopeptide (TPR) repeat protein/tRNA A-37 threonylcarbamoyl transferase component Bud32